MADSREMKSGIPSWDGSARTWRRYTREVAWYVQGTAVHKRRYCASQLLGRLTGPARLLAMSWSRMLVDRHDGTKILLRKLAASPLVRKSLPNAAAICQQYFAFRRSHQESIGNFLVRETLVHEEFCEATIRLYEEKQGVSQEDRDFGLPADEWGGCWWSEDWLPAEPMGVAAAATADGIDDGKLREAQQAEQMAESLALEAQRTWTEAQKATAALKKDRGFGATLAATQGPMRCFNCGGPHMAKDCPDRRHPYFGKSKGKGKSKQGYMTDMDAYYVKGKTKQAKGKNKKGFYMDADAIWKGKGKGHDWMPRTVNAYSSDMYIGGLELTPTMEAAAATSTATRPELGMVDCGATASAAPEAVVKGLIASILEKDHGARVDIDQSARPYFRFGDGRWGRALYRVQLTSSVSGSTRSFALYALPNPKEYFQAGFDKASLVPILIGMDFLGKIGNGMIIDFTTGLSTSTKDDNPKVFQLSQNHKGHFMLDISEYLTLGHQNHEGHAHVVVSADAHHVVKPEAHVLEFHVVQFDLTAADAEHELHQSRLQLLEMYQRSRQLQGLPLSAHFRSMLATAQSLEAPTTSSTRFSNHVDDQCERRHRGGRDPGGSGEGQGQSREATTTIAGSDTLHEDGQEGSQGTSQVLAVLRQPPAQHGPVECPRPVGAVPSLRSASAVHATEGITVKFDASAQCCDGQEDAGAAQGGAEWSTANGQGVPPHDGEDLRGGGPGEVDQGTARIIDNDTATNELSVDDVWERHDPITKPHRCGRPGRGTDRGLRGRGVPGAVRDMNKCKPLTTKLAHRVMAMATLMATAASTSLVNLQLDGRDGVWEIACSLHSWLSESADNHGLAPRRINYQAGYDLYKETTWDQLRDLRQQKKPRRLWFSLPCTKWCPWTAINYREPEGKEVLEAQRRKERKMLRHAVKFIMETLLDDPDVDIYWEWPTRCLGWSQQVMLDLSKWLDQNDFPWLACRVDGCAYGLRSSHGEAFVHKRWTIMTTSERFHHEYRSKLCPGNHLHCNIAGNETSRTAFYPWRTVEAFVRTWKKQVVPDRHHALLSLRDDLPAIPDLQEPFDELTEAEVDLVDESVMTTTMMEDHHYMVEADRLQLEHQAREACVRGHLEFADCEDIVRHLFEHNKQGGESHHRGTTPGKNSFALGGYSHGAFKGVLNYTRQYPEFVKYVNKFLRRHLPPDAVWSSVAINFNVKTSVHCDHNNLPEVPSYLIGLGSYVDGGLWCQGEPPEGKKAAHRRLPNGRMVRGYLQPTHHQVVKFDSKPGHATQSWKGSRIVIATYVTRLASQLSATDKEFLVEVGFPKKAFDFPNYQFAVEQGQPASSSTTTTTTTNETVLPSGVDQKEYEAWKAKVAKFHRAAGHPTNRNLARIVEDGGHAEWKVRVALEHKCSACEAGKLGGTSAGTIPPANTQPLYRAWEAVTVDAAEWPVPGSKQKVKFLLFMDYATKLRAVAPLKVYDALSMDAESADMVIQSLSEKWLSVFPKPKVVIMDAAKTFTSAKVHEFLASINILPHFVAETEHWSHGVAEAAVQDVKATATAIQRDALHQDPRVTLYLAVASLNSTEYTAGYSAYQWAYGQNYNITDEDYRTFASIPANQQQDFTALVTARQQAEEIARKTKAQRVLTRLANTSVRQPLREFKEMDLVKIWRKFWPTEVHKGPRGGLKKAGRPHWIGPGRVVFHEILPHQEQDDRRRHIVWVIIGTQLYRCSVHSVRHVTESERFQFEVSGEENYTKWKTLADILPRREYQDVADEEPDEHEREVPDLPKEPDSTTTVVAPVRRLRQKTSFRPGEWTEHPVRDRLQDEVEDVNDYGPSTSGLNDVEVSEGSGQGRSDAPVPEPPQAKRAKVAGADDPQRSTTAPEASWVEALHVEAAMEKQEMDIFTAFNETFEFLKIEFEVPPVTSHRQAKLLERNPVAYLVKKMRDSEVVLSRISPDERRLFERAKTKEVDSFLSNEAVRKCLSSQEVREAYDSNRIVKARWVLTWKLVPPEDREAAKADAVENPKTLHNRDGSRKAKARIVLLGFQHPSLLDRNFKTAAPVQSTIGRNLLYQMSVQHQWEIEGLDLATAFLQTQPTEADERLWTTGVEELRTALNIGSEGIMRILRNIYGSTTAPRGLWLDLHKKLTALDAIPVMAERCLWIWLSKERKDRDLPLVIGAMGGHVDDFHRLGDGSPEWLEIKKKIDTAYRWGMAKKGNYRHAGTDVATVWQPNGEFAIEVDQSYYVEGIPDLAIPPERLRDNGPLRAQEVGACRTTLGALQWLAIQTQPQLCARCNILLTEIVVEGNLAHAREIQEMLGEIRRHCVKLRFFKISTAKHWTELVVISMGDQAHTNRPRGDSTGGMVTMIAGPESLLGKVCPMTLVAWRTWKLQRKSISSNDAEVQSILEAEDQNFRVRLVWTELHGASRRGDPRENLVFVAEQQILQVRGVLCTDSRGGYDAVEVNESPLLGLSNLRAALQAFQLRENLRRVRCELRWVASDYDLADGLTKKKSDARNGLMKYLETWLWSIAFDKNFVSAKKSKQQGSTAIGKVDDYLNAQSNATCVQMPSLNEFCGGAEIHVIDGMPMYSDEPPSL